MKAIAGQSPGTQARAGASNFDDLYVSRRTRREMGLFFEERGDGREECAPRARLVAREEHFPRGFVRSSMEQDYSSSPYKMSEQATLSSQILQPRILISVPLQHPDHDQ